MLMGWCAMDSEKITGALYYNRQDLEKQLASGQELAISVVGLAAIAQDVPPELARQAIRSRTVRGVFRASQAVKDALADRTH
jgi:hypothetical protein